MKYIKCYIGRIGNKILFLYRARALLVVSEEIAEAAYNENH